MDEAATNTLSPNAAQARDRDVLFQAYRLGPFNLRHRVVMAPLTRSRSPRP
ncbi:NADH:flavin oxidoreductase [Rhizobium grahamii]|uniref:NADH:flavin oxidoreductase n=1 Tax=Rhizobium grahamii CCGE 502 TaxID=990285 RepID=S3HLF2_9HYPH|nr:NADH:flavin oxidoreductase [Rhizobium grahamii]EPE94206.1 NADH:flavin oxidoreductase [Rhizobium grahamii CCGE 502]